LRQPTPPHRQGGYVRTTALAAALVLAATMQAIIVNLFSGVLPEFGRITLAVLLLLATGVVGVLTIWQARLVGRTANVPAKFGQDPRNRARLLALVKERASGQLGQALDNVVTLTLRLETRPELVEFPAEVLIRPSQSTTSRQIPGNQSIVATFEQLDRAMIIAGPPGAGKTTLLNKLTLALVNRASADPRDPIPVLVNLASWASKRASLEVWLGHELSIVYGIDARLGTELAESGVVLPLLDGLDEVPARYRSECVSTIRSYQDRRAQSSGKLAPIVICCRLAELESLSGPLPAAAGAVCIRQPSDRQMTAYLRKVGATEILEEAGSDREMWDFLRSPLTLSLVALTPRSSAIHALHEPAHRRLAALLDAYVLTMLTPVSAGGRARAGISAWTPKRVRASLAWLATNMNAHDLSEFHLERLDRSWLGTRRARTLVLLAPVICSMALIGAVAWYVARRENAFAAGFNVLLYSVLALGLALTLGSRVSAPTATLRWSWRVAGVRPARSVALGAFYGVVVGAVLGVRTMTKFSDAGPEFVLRDGLLGAAVGALAGFLAWPLGRLGILGAAGMAGVVSLLLFDAEVGLGVVLVGIVVGGLAIENPEVRRDAQVGGLLGAIVGVAVNVVAPQLVGGVPVRLPVRVLLDALVGGGVGGVLIGGLYGLLISMLSSGVSANPTRPNEGIHRSIWYAASIGGTGACVLGVAVPFWTAPPPSDLTVGASTALVALTFGGLTYGGSAAIRHYAVRLSLFAANIAPIRIVQFLDSASDALLIRRIGGGYRFPHRVLQDYFATCDRGHAVVGSRLDQVGE